MLNEHAIFQHLIYLPFAFFLSLFLFFLQKSEPKKKSKMGLYQQQSFMVRHHQLQLLNLVKNLANLLSKMLSPKLLQRQVFLNKSLKLPNQKGRSALRTLVAQILQLSQRNLGHCTAGITSPNPSLSNLSKRVRQKFLPERKTVELSF